MKKLLALAAMCLCGWAGAARAQFSPSNALPAFYVQPTSGMGTITSNTLTLTPTVNGFTVGGQLQITIPAGPVSGVLAQWTVIRRIDPGYSAGGITTSTTLTGFSTPPAGTFGTTSGSVVTDWRFSAGSPTFVGGSQSTVPMTLVNGVDSPSWSSLNATSSPFTWTAGFFPAAVLQQQFTLNGNYTSGAGGVWVVDVPVTSVVLPEPSSLMVIITLAGFGLVRCRRV